MPEQELHPAATKFIGSLVKSLQILCNGQVEFSESIELIGHINVRVDRKYKFDYIVDEQVSKEGEDASTTFLSNSYHSLHPHRQDRKKISGLEQDSKHEISQSTSQNTPKRSKQANNVAIFPAPRSSDGNCNDSQVKDLDNQNYTVSVESTSGAQISKENQMVVKLEEDEDSNDCMVLPASPDDYEAIGEMDEESRHDSFPISGSSGSHESQNAQTVSGRRRKKRKLQEQGARDSFESKAELEEGGKKIGRRRGASELVGKFAAYECSYCSVILTQYEDLSLHSKNCPSPSCSMICLTCGEKLPSKPEMRQHLKFVHGHKTFGCKFCDIVFLSSSGLLSHTKAKHKPDPKTLCQICGQAFHNRANLEGHMNMHLGIRPFKCKKCGKSYGHSKSLITHEKNCKSVKSSKSVSLSPSVNNSQRSSDQASFPTCAPTPNVPTGVVLQEKGTSPTSEQNPQDMVQPDSDQTYSFNEPFESYHRPKENICNREANLQVMQNTNQPFSFSGSYQSLRSVDMSSIASTGHVGEVIEEEVYPQASTGFVLPQVAYGMYAQGILPDHR